MKACVNCKRIFTSDDDFCVTCGSSLQEFDIDLPKRPLMRNGWFWWTIALGVLCFFLFVAAVGNASDEEEQRSTNTSQTTAAADNPTSVPTATVTSEPTCPTAEEDAYFLELSEQILVIGTAATELGAQFYRLSENLSLIASQNWMIPVAVHLSSLDIAADTILRLDGPSSVESIHAEAEAMAQLVKTGVDLYTSAIDNIDPDAMEVGTLKFVEATEKVGSIADSRVTFCDE